MKTTSIICLGFALFLSNCNVKKTSGLDSTGTVSFIFGRYHGFCMSDCTTLYKIDNQQLFADQVEKLQEPAQLIFSGKPMSNKDFSTAQALLAAFPKQLLDEKEETIGCPDCADQGGYYLEYSTGSAAHSWRLDTNTGALPEYLAAYAQLIEETLTKLEK